MSSKEYVNMKLIRVTLIVSALGLLGGCVAAPVSPGYYGGPPGYSAPGSGYYGPAPYGPPSYYAPSMGIGIYGGGHDYGRYDYGHGHEYR